MVRQPHPAEAPDLDRQQRIFVNRNLRLTSVQAIGFDLDHTLALYKPVPFERLAFERAKHKLVELGYPRAVLPLRYDHSYVIRGLIVDRQRGNIIKMDRHHYVVQASHGTRKLPPEMRKRLYTTRRIRVTGQTYAPVDTLFSLPEISLYAQLVDLADREPGRPNYRRLYEDVRRVVDEAHADGSIKNLIARAPLRYLAIDPNLPATLNRMVTHGVRLFLLTNSEAAYTDLIMDTLLSGKLPRRPHWTDCFDLVVVRARKPDFFARHDPLVPLDPQTLGASRRGTRFAFSGGSVVALERALGVTGDRVLYFGDHTYGDILRSKRSRGWRTAMIIQELADELRQQASARPRWREIEALERRIDRLAAWRDFLERARDGEVSGAVVSGYLRGRGLRGGARQIRSQLESVRGQLRELERDAGVREAEVEAMFNRNWGPVFRAGREISHFGNQVQDFACIYTSRVSNFLNYPMDKYFVTPHAAMPHEV
jgi:HAD superfamily 5'-nucleotidase-like hydrolase